MSTALFVMACLLCLVAGAGAGFLWADRGAAAARLLGLQAALRGKLSALHAPSILVRHAFRVTVRRPDRMATILVDETGEPVDLLARRALVSLLELERAPPLRRAPERPPPTPRIPVVRMARPVENINVFSATKGPPS